MLRAVRRLEQRIDAAMRDLIFRALFSTIFVGIGSEHLFDDRLIQNFMPSWVPYPAAASRASGVLLLVGGVSILTGYHIQLSARVLGAFLVVVTLAVHLPGCLFVPDTIAPESGWLWIVFQRSNLVKNLCLLGVCVHLTTHEVGRYSVDAWLAHRRHPSRR